MKLNYALKPYNTFNVQATAHYFCTIDTVLDVQELLRLARFAELPKLILGGGSNILFTQDYPGLVIKNNILGIEPIAEDDKHIWITVGAGENWHNFVRYCIHNHYAGVENLSLIPGTVGAAPIQNIGAYGVEVESVFESLQAIELSSGEIKQFTHADCQFGYRNSIFKHKLKNQYMISHVTLKLNKKAQLNTDYGDIQSRLREMQITHPTIEDVSQAVIHIRNQKLPNPQTLPNAGSFFKNPIISQNDFKTIHHKFPHIPHFNQPHDKIKIPAAWLIDQCQLKGMSENGVGISPHHALVIVNYSSQDGASIKKLSERIQQIVIDKFNIQLEPEVNII